jgi:hypothetical protein
MQPTYYYLVRRYTIKEIGRGVGLGSRKRVQNSDDLFQSLFRLGLNIECGRTGKVEATNPRILVEKGGRSCEDKKKLGVSPACWGSNPTPCILTQSN